MFHRFVAGSAIGSLVIAIAAIALITVGLSVPATQLLTLVWCFVPFVWGVWAMLTPKAWLPERFPYWGAILGFIGGFTSAFILNLPSRVFAMPVPVTGRLLAVVTLVLVYYFLWMLVRVAYLSLVPPGPRAKENTTSTQLNKAA